MDIYRKILKKIKKINHKNMPSLIPFNQWINKYLGHRFTLPPNQLHKDLDNDLQELHLQRGSKLNYISSRGSAKTSRVTFAYILYCALHGLEKHIVLGADESGQAFEYVEDISNELLTNELIRKNYPIKWQSSQGKIKFSNDVLIRATSTLKKIRGRKFMGVRPTLIVLDDCQGSEHITSPVMRQRSLQWLYKDILECGTAESNVLVLGTSLHREAIVEELARNPVFKTKRYKSIINFPINLHLWKNWESILFDYDNDQHEANAKLYYESQKLIMDEGAKVLWPERISLYELMVKRATQGAASFATEHQSEPTDPTLCEWPSEYFEGNIWFNSWNDLKDMQWKKKVIAIDPSMGKNDKSDYSAIVMIAESYQGVYYVDADLKKGRDVQKMCADLCGHVQLWQPQELILETVLFQDLIKDILKTVSVELAVGLPPITKFDDKLKKEVRIRKITPYLASKKIKFRKNSPGIAILLDQARDFAAGEWDDGIDALAMGLVALDKKNSFILY